ncbi:MAG: hypothetical protein M1834_001287 [Cirrosporium novae-zelandiae]|nr:MAG: hypothetical protein M1834_001287 [Cirrosporium novae-zelandiae]
MSSFSKSFGTLSATMRGLVVSSILIPAATASFFAGKLADDVGRPRGSAIGALIFGIGTALEAAAVDIAMLIVGRAITGIGEGLFLSTGVVYICEISPPRLRGPLASTAQFATTVGICLGYFISYGTLNIGSSASWRLPLAVHSFCAFGFAVACLFLPQSPRWLTQVGRGAGTGRVWDRLGVSAAEREKETPPRRSLITTTPCPTPTPSSQPGKLKAKLNPYFRIFRKDVRRRTFLGVFLMGMQQLSGIDGVLYYAPLLFRQAGLSSDEASFLASGVSALLMMLFTIPAFLLADKWGRRTSTISGGVVLAACMLLIGSLYAAKAVHARFGPARWVVIASLYIFAIVYDVTWAVSMRVYASEIQPPLTRAPATSIALSSNWFVNFIVAFTTPIFLAHSAYGVYFLFGSCILFTVLVCVVGMPETRGRSLEAIDERFRKQRPTVKAVGHVFGNLFGFGKGGCRRRGGEEEEGNEDIMMVVVSPNGNTEDETGGVELANVRKSAEETTVEV